MGIRRSKRIGAQAKDRRPSQVPLVESEMSLLKLAEAEDTVLSHSIESISPLRPVSKQSIASDLETFTQGQNGGERILPFKKRFSLLWLTLPMFIVVALVNKWLSTYHIYKHILSIQQSIQ